MKRTKALVQAFMPWAGLTVGIFAVVLVHQFGSDGTFNACATVSPGPLLVVAAAGLVACVAAGLGSWRSTHRSTSVARRVIGIVSIGCAVLFAFAILLPMIAALVLPPCFH
jgi:hypothetical protein